MKLIIIVLAFISLIFSVVVFNTTIGGSQKCGGFTGSTNYKISFFPEYVNSLFLQNKNSSGSSSTLGKMLDCSVQPATNFIPVDALLLSLGLFVYYFYLSNKKQSHHTKDLSDTKVSE